MMTHQHPPELTGVDLPGIDPREKESFDELLVQTVLDRGIMTPKQIEDCVREKQVMESLSTRQSISQICIRRGYVSQAQIKELMRTYRYQKIRKEDVEIGQVAVKRDLVSSEQVRTCLSIQETAFKQGQTSIPRLMRLLGDRGLLDAEKAMTILDAVYKIDNRGKDEIREEAVEQWAWDREVRQNREPRRRLKREADRFPVPDAYIRYRTGVLGSMDDMELAPLINLSKTGLQFLSKEKLKVGQKLRLEILVPAFDDKLCVKGEVRWIGRAGLTALYRVGARFFGLSKESATCLEKLADDPFLRATGRSPYRVYW